MHITNAKARPMPDFDAVACQFDRHRALPVGAALAVRGAMLAQLAERPRVLDVGVGTGRVGWPFVASGDDYVGIDLSYGMVRAFRQRAPAARLAQANGRALPFADRTFDAVLLVQIFGGLGDWRAVIDEAIRVLRPDGSLMLGRTVAPEDGIDACMKRQLAVILGDTADANTRQQAELHLSMLATQTAEIDAVQWSATRTPRGFLDRHAGGARFSRLPESLRETALGRLRAWAIGEFGGLDTPRTETHRFALRTFTFGER